MEEFLLQTGLTRNYIVNYDNIYNELSPYSQSVVDVLGASDYILPASSSPVFQKNYTQFYLDYEMGTPEYPDPMIAIKNDGLTAVELFNEFRGKFDGRWAQILQN